MSLLFETIRLQDGVFKNLEYHTHRLNRSRKFLFGENDLVLLKHLLKVPDGFETGIFKCKVSYGKSIEEIQFEPYQKRAIKSLMLVDDNIISYSFKYSNRSHLLQLMERRGDCDDILIVKNGCITDTSFSNIVFFDGTKWLTPAKPLLIGTMREYLLKARCIEKAKIKVADIKNFTTARLINAMLPLETSKDIPVQKISY